MADIAEFRKNPFWKKKFRKVVATRDADNSGTISRGDFEIIVERYKKFGTGRADRLEKLAKVFFDHCDDIGLSDANEELTYKQFEERWMAGMSKPDSLRKAKESFKEMFTNLDIDGNGVITFNEWKNHYIATGIAVEHARASFDAMDVDNDGNITRDEFVNYHMEFFYSPENKLNSAILFGPL